MKKRLFALFGLCTILGLGMAFGCSRNTVAVKAETEVVETEKNTVVLPTIEHLTIKSSISEGEVGDEVKLTIGANKLYVLDFQKLIVKANGVEVDKNTFTFELVAGVNTVTLENVVISALFPSPVQELAESVLNGNFTWAMLLNPSTIIALIGLVISGGFGVALLKVYGKYKSEKTITREGIVSSIEKLIPDACEKVISNLIENVISPLIAKVGNVEEAMTVFSRCLALVQENTPEARLAILDELSKIKISDVSLVEQVEDKIKEALKLAEEKYVEYAKLLSEMKVSNANAIIESAGTLANEIDKSTKKDEVEDGTSI